MIPLSNLRNATEEMVVKKETKMEQKTDDQIKMAQEEVVRIDFEIGRAMAKKFAEQFNYHIDHKIKEGSVDFLGIAKPFLKELVSQARQDEREACAKIADELGLFATGEEVAEEIRERK